MEVTTGLNANYVYPLNASFLEELDSLQWGPEVKWRNVSIASLGSVFNCLAFVIVFKSKKINRRHKLLLLNLIVSDITFLLVCAALGGYLFTGPCCITMTNLMVVTFLNTYLFVLLLSAVNFIAVYMPFWYRALRMKHCGVATCLVWLLSSSFSIGGIGVEEHPSGQSCLIHMVISSYGMLMITTLTFISSIAVAVFNIAVVVKMKKEFVFSGDGSNNPQSSSLNNQSIGAAGTHASRHQRVSKTIRISCSGRCNKVTPAATSQISPQARPAAGAEDPDIVCVRQSQTPLAEHGDRSYEMVLRASIPMADVQITQGQHAPSDTVSPTSSSHLQTSNSSRNGRSPRAAIPPRHRRHVDKMCKTLLILTTYSCLLTLPFCVYLVFLATRDVKPESIASAPSHVIIIACPIVNACINPFFYGLNFINWQFIFDACRGRRETTS